MILVVAAGAISALGLIGLSRTPYDCFFWEHQLMLAVWILPLPVAAIAFTTECFSRSSIWHFMSGCLLGLATLALLFAIGLFLTAPNLRDRIIFQKVLVAVAIGWFVFLLLRVAAASITYVAFRSPKFEQESAQYFRDLQKRHRKPIARKD